MRYLPPVVPSYNLHNACNINKQRSIDHETRANGEEPKEENVHWTLNGFHPKVNDSSFTLNKWIRNDQDQQEDASTSRFSVLENIKMPQYTEVEYENYLIDPNWSREETDYLMELCSTFDLRFFVIQDRYDFKGEKRTLEDIEDRVFSILRKLHRIKPHLEDTFSGGDSRANLSNYDYNKQKEAERRSHLEAIYARSKSDITDEQFLLIESKRLQASHQRLEMERDVLFRLLNGGTESVSFGNRPSLSLMLDRGGSNSASGTLKGNRMKKRKTSSSVEIRSVDSGDLAILTPTFAMKKEKLVSGAYARSTRLTPVKPIWIKQIDRILTDSGVLATRPLLPTKRLVEAFDRTRLAAATLLEYKKQTEKMESELKGGSSLSRRNSAAIPESPDHFKRRKSSFTA